MKISWIWVIKSFFSISAEWENSCLNETHAASFHCRKLNIKQGWANICYIGPHCWPLPASGWGPVETCLSTPALHPSLVSSFSKCAFRKIAPPVIQALLDPLLFDSFISCLTTPSPVKHSHLQSALFHPSIWYPHPALPSPPKPSPCFLSPSSGTFLFFPYFPIAVEMPGAPSLLPPCTCEQLFSWFYSFLF